MLGNIMEKEIIELVGSERQYKFGQDKRDSLQKVCRECDVLFRLQRRMSKEPLLDHFYWKTGYELSL